MKLSAILCLLVISACACNSGNLQTKLFSEQKLLKDSANNINDRIGNYLHNNHSDSAEAVKMQLAPVYARLIAIQASMDSLATAKK